MTACDRCGQEVRHGATNRFQYRLEDYADSSAAKYDGRLCMRCWDEALAFLGIGRATA